MLTYQNHIRRQHQPLVDQHIFKTSSTKLLSTFYMVIQLMDNGDDVNMFLFEFI